MKHANYNVMMRHTATYQTETNSHTNMKWKQNYTSFII